ncbi:hypothetical protein NCCP2331_10900 [Sporosarcina sp. NCCP-2331]|nr:hypothetical protein NCCP2331_10900 [Sporosarcina sp. NCCP-2331]GLB55047.1 hypothetical protein NCCP2378_08320 [Sporosarcina sp. NCCP-2378]
MQLDETKSGKRRLASTGVGGLIDKVRSLQLFEKTETTREAGACSWMKPKAETAV